MRKITAFFLLVSFCSCAKIVAPSGGPMDETGPSLVSVNPENGKTGYKGARIELEFDEFIRQIDPTLVSISPYQDETPEYVISGKKLLILLNDDLYENTTYNINYNNSIRDFTEGNEMANFVYVFSTGETIDSLVIEGNVIDARTGEWNKETEGLSVLLYPAGNDTSFLTEKPFYFTRPDTLGHFKFEYLKEGTYDLYALIDQNFNAYFDQISEQLAFHGKPIEAGSPYDTLREEYNLALYTEEQDEIYLQSGDELSEGHGSMILSKRHGDIAIEYEKGRFYDTHLVQSEKRDSIEFWYLPKDTLENSLTLLNGDSRIDTVLLKPFEIGEFHQLFEFKSKRKVFQGDTVFLRFKHPIRQIDQRQISLKMDSTLVSCEMKIDPKNPKRCFLEFAPNDSLAFQLDILPGALENIYKQSNADTLIQKFSFMPPEITGELFLEFSPPSSSAYLYELLENAVVLRSGKLEEGQTYVGEFSASTYQLRIIEDRNANGHWDPGKIAEGIQPEKVILIPEEIRVQARFENNIIIEL